MGCLKSKVTNLKRVEVTANGLWDASVAAIQIRNAFRYPSTVLRYFVYSHEIYPLA